MQNQTVLVISPHPDDLEIGMGGTVAKLVSEGYSIVSVVVTDGRGSTNSLGLSANELAEKRKEEVKESSAILGVEKLVCFDLHDVKTERNRTEFKKLLTENLNIFSPFQIYVPHFHIDKHPTHRTVSGIVTGLCSCAKGKDLNGSELWFYEVWTPFAEYDRIEDITSFVSLKERAVNAHESQLAYKDYTQGVLGLNRYRAVFNDIYDFSRDDAYAEVFIRYKP